MNQKTAKWLWIASGRNQAAYQELKREWATLSQTERARRRRAAKAAAKKPAAPAEAAQAAPETT